MKNMPKIVAQAACSALSLFLILTQVKISPPNKITSTQVAHSAPCTIRRIEINRRWEIRWRLIPAVATGTTGDDAPAGGGGGGMSTGGCGG